ncbi:ABC transporter permease (plasmid) [Salinigranum rubrum]|uniref:ABC transporter permease n=1 Tax=Salinigranum rubrum TaxID=755307 RepID=A0A2I8VRL9_9EURY|nr:carbohydrate ABC transporter permease [Salinigranum rubrum]AUV84557.1 ABC transporter permease [Salinigranum rubrum]
MWIPETITIDAYRAILVQGPYFDYVVNSVVSTSIAVGLGLLLGIPATYVIVRYDFPLNLDHHLGFFFLSIFMLPPIAATIPYFNIFQALGALDSSVWLGLVYAVFTLPLIVWFTRGFIDDIPESLGEAAEVDGASEFQTFYYVYLPLIKPGIGAAAIISFILTWNEYFFALVLTRREAKPLSVATTEFVGQYNIAWNELSAGLVITIAPVAVFLLLTQRYIISGLTKGAVKE